MDQSTVAAIEFYKPCKFGGRSSINGGDMVHFMFHENIWRHLAAKRRGEGLQLGHSTVAAHEVYEGCALSRESRID